LYCKQQTSGNDSPDSSGVGATRSVGLFSGNQRIYNDECICCKEGDRKCRPYDVSPPRSA
ncbi:MAG: hypothetical protein LBR10_12370, partial [Prevotellaceae bacterium]|nr:hypothetical protein [Prevotellaceae bacterium]